MKKLCSIWFSRLTPLITGELNSSDLLAIEKIRGVQSLDEYIGYSPEHQNMRDRVEKMLENRGVTIYEVKEI